MYWVKATLCSEEVEMVTGTGGKELHCKLRLSNVQVKSPRVSLSASFRRIDGFKSLLFLFVNQSRLFHEMLRSRFKITVFLLEKVFLNQIREL